MHRWLSIACASAALFATPLAAQLSGSWSGTYTISIPCSTGGRFDSTGPAAAVLEETPDADVSGTLLVKDFLFGDILTCAPESRAPASFAISGRVSGAAFTGTAAIFEIVVPLSGTVSATQFIGTIASDVATGTFTLTRDTSAAANLTGTWSGSIGGVHVCAGSATPISGPVTVWLRQSGDQIAGTAISLMIYIDPLTCEAEGPVNIPLGINATVSGNVLRGHLTTPYGDKPLVASIADASILGAGNDTDVSATIALTKVDSIEPDSDWSGVWKGTATTEESVAWACSNISTLRYQETVAISLLHLGNAFIGTASASGAKYVVADANRHCTVATDPPVSFVALGMVDGAETYGAFAFDDELVDFDGRFSANTLSGSAGEFSTFSLTRQAPTGTAPVMITSFTARPATVHPGEAVKLSWVTSYASSVIIDHGLGSQPPKGSITIYPTETTTYVLTASSSSDTSTAYRRVNVMPRVTGRRRAVRH